MDNGRSDEDEVGDEPGNYGKGSLGLGFLGPVADPEVRSGEASEYRGLGVFGLWSVVSGLGFKVLGWAFRVGLKFLVESQLGA